MIIDWHFGPCLWPQPFVHLLISSCTRKNESQDENSRMQRIRDIIRIPVEDRLFVRVLTAWMILGFGVIMTFSFKDRISCRQKGLNFSNEEIALVGVSVFFVFKVIGAVLFGKLFDRINFMRFRIFLNLFLLIAILVYFNSETFLGVSIGTGLAGLATGGANIAWNLWVTKLAPKGKVSEYMSVHMFLTGLRGASAPISRLPFGGSIGLFRNINSFLCIHYPCDRIVCHHSA